MPMMQLCGYDFFDVYGFFEFWSLSRGVILSVVAFDFGFAYHYFVFTYFQSHLESGFYSNRVPHPLRKHNLAFWPKTFGKNN